TLQHALYDRLRPVLLPAKGKGAPRPGANELAEMWRAAGRLERVGGQHKEGPGGARARPPRQRPGPAHALCAPARPGARALIYGPLNAVVHHQVVERWLDAVVGFEPGNDSERLAWAFCLAQLARRTGQRALDVDDSHQRSVLVALRSTEGVPEHWVRM